MAKAGSEDYKPFYFTSLIHLLSDDKRLSSHKSPATSVKTSIPHSKNPSAKVSFVMLSLL